MPIKILLIDDHPVFRMGIEAAVASRTEGMRIVSVDTLGDARNILTEQPDIALALLDVLLLGENGLQALPSLRREFPALPVIILTGLQQSDMIEKALTGGAQGFISKSRNAEEIISAIHTVLNGGIAVSAELATSDMTVPITPPLQGENPLSDRLKLVLAELVKGQPNKQIALQLGIAETTVRGYVSEILKALGAKNRTEAAAMARSRGWI